MNKQSFLEHKNIKIKDGFTIVELLIVIVIIGILAAITVVAYIGISKKATEASITSDLTGAKRQLELYKAEYEIYPTTMDENKCPTAPENDIKYCLKNKDFEYTTIDNGITYSLKLTKSNITLEVTNSSTPKIAESVVSDWVTIGTQTWATKNLNVGIMIPGIPNRNSQNNNSITEKFCYDDNEANCTTNGALYQWNEAVNYHERVFDNTPQQGLCETGAHVPTADDWIKLVSYLGMTPTEINSSFSSFAGSQGKKLKIHGESNLNIPLAGYRIFEGYDGAMFWGSGSSSTFWSATENGSNGYAYTFSIASGSDGIYIGTGRMDLGYSIRCIKD